MSASFIVIRDIAKHDTYLKQHPMVKVHYFRNKSDSIPAESRSYPNLALARYWCKILNSNTTYGVWREEKLK